MILKENMKSDFDEFLVDDGIYEDVNDIAIKRATRKSRYGYGYRIQRSSFTKILGFMHWTWQEQGRSCKMSIRAIDDTST